MQLSHILLSLSLLGLSPAACAITTVIAPPITAAQTGYAVTPIAVQDNKIYLPCQFDALKTDCLLDSGSGFSMVSSELFDDYPPSGRIKYNSGTGTAIAIDEIRIHQLNIAHTHFTNWPVARLPTVSGFTNAIGLDVFSKIPVLFDFKNRAILLNPPKNSTSPDYPFTIELGIILLPIKIGTESMVAGWDTGASVCIIDQDYIVKNPAEFTYVKEARGTDSTKTTMKMKIYILKNLVICNLALKDVRVAAMDFSEMKQVHPRFPEFILGYNVIIQHSWYFNIAQRKWRLD